jgi:hypothetical protein
MQCFIFLELGRVACLGHPGPGIISLKSPSQHFNFCGITGGKTVAVLGEELIKSLSE